MPELIAVWLRRLLLTFPHPATLDDDVVLVLPALDLDRQGRQDVTWIEQVASKQEDGGANKAVAVCPSGFTKGARRLAKAKQINLRMITSVTGPEVFGWLGLKTVRYRDWNMEYRIIRFGVKESQHVEIAPEMDGALRSTERGLVPVLVRRSDGKAMSVRDVWNTVPKDEIFAELEATRSMTSPTPLTFTEIHRRSRSGV